MIANGKDFLHNPPMQKLIVMADYICGVFIPEGGTSPEELGASEAFCKRFDEWLLRYKEPNEAPVGYDRRQYNDEGRLLAKEIQKLVGSKYSVTYRFLCPVTSDAEHLNWLEELIDP